MNEIITEPEIGWKFLDLKDGQIRSRNGYPSTTWTVGEWKHHAGVIRVCERGFHCSPGIGPAMYYVSGAILARVEAKGQVWRDPDGATPKSAYSDMRITEAYHWTAKDAVEVAVFAAELVFPVWVKKYPEDDRPAKAIEAAKKYLADPDSITGKELEAAIEAAYAAYGYGAAYWPDDYAAMCAGRAAAAAYNVMSGVPVAAREIAAGGALCASYAATGGNATEYHPAVEAWLQEKVKTLKPVE